jgi:hypothetical protein
LSIAKGYARGVLMVISAAMIFSSVNALSRGVATGCHDSESERTIVVERMP